jgi:5-methylcytosine-specific restriction endonuclease McrA
MRPERRGRQDYLAEMSVVERTSVFVRRILIYVFSLFLLLASVQGVASENEHSTRKSHRTYQSHYPRHYSGSRKAAGVTRTKKGKIKRSQSEKKKFLHAHGYKRVPPGYEVDHITPLYKGGADKFYNMQLIPKSQHRAKHHRR